MLSKNDFYQSIYTGEQLDKALKETNVLDNSVIRNNVVYFPLTGKEMDELIKETIKNGNN